MTRHLPTLVVSQKQVEINWKNTGETGRNRKVRLMLLVVNELELSFI